MDRHGCCALAKRLDRGRFRRPRVKDGSFCWEIDASAVSAVGGQLAWLEQSADCRVPRMAGARRVPSYSSCVNGGPTAQLLSSQPALVSRDPPCRLRAEER
jgi:hypothetical protein